MLSIQHDIVTSLGLRGTGCCSRYNTTLSRHSACGVQDAALDTTRHRHVTRPAGYRILLSIQHDIVASLGLRGTSGDAALNKTRLSSRHSACGVLRGMLRSIEHDFFAPPGQLYNLVSSEYFMGG